MRGHGAGVVATALVAVLVAGCGAPDPADGHAQAARPKAGKASAHPRAGDFSGDGRDDFAVLSGRRLTVVYGSAHGLDPRLRTVVPQPALASGSERTRLFRADLDRDGFTDLLLSPESRPPAVLWGGPRGLAASAKQLAGPAKGPAAIGDFDGDGATDVFVPGGATGPEGTVWYGPVDRDGVPDHRQELRYEHPADSAPAHVVAGDFDGDKATDLALWFAWTDPESEGDGDVTYTGQHRLRGGPEGLRLTERRRPPDLGLTGQPGDVDGDGIDDLYAAHFTAYRQQLAAGYRLSTRSGPETGRKGGVGTAAPPGLGGGPHYGGMGDTALGDVTGDGRADLVTSATGANDNNGAVWLIPDVLRADTADIRAVTLDTPGVPGSNTPSPGRGPTRHRITVLSPLLDTDGDGHLDVVFGSTGYLDAKERDLDAFWVMRGTDRGMTFQRHFTAEDLR
ncbi:FG-GAP and VCBS repeat-containing protein [Streptomyces sp. NPDC001904]|uniref:FG-GAP and VCBS repeat-containing protein n=1 Tax=Streptomyces sp. NPDC001904 TaxID=3154531 RepID=UPI003320DA3E